MLVSATLQEGSGGLEVSQSLSGSSKLLAHAVEHRIVCISPPVDDAEAEFLVSGRHHGATTSRAAGFRSSNHRLRQVGKSRIEADQCGSLFVPDSLMQTLGKPSHARSASVHAVLETFVLVIVEIDCAACDGLRANYPKRTLPPHHIRQSRRTYAAAQSVRQIFIFSACPRRCGTFPRHRIPTLPRARLVPRTHEGTGRRQRESPCQSTSCK